MRTSSKNLVISVENISFYVQGRLDVGAHCAIIGILISVNLIASYLGACNCVQFLKLGPEL
jgi:hypothetical protein